MKKTFMLVLYLISFISSTAIANEHKQKADESKSIPFIIQQHIVISPKLNGMIKLIDLNPNQPPVMEDSNIQNINTDELVLLLNKVKNAICPFYKSAAIKIWITAGWDASAKIFQIGIGTNSNSAVEVEIACDK